jgi:hypothetical protein
MNKYLSKAKKLNRCGFFVAGCGCFDVTQAELSKIIEWIEKDDFKSIKKLYDLLSKERL